MSQAVDHFLAEPHRSELAKYKISKQEWAVMQDIEYVLGVRHDIRVSHVL
jgi:hypothetical protein